MPGLFVQATYENKRLRGTTTDPPPGRSARFLAGLHGLKLLFQLRRIFLEVSDLLAGLALRIAAGRNHNRPHSVRLIVVDAANRRHQGAGRDEQLPFAEVVEVSIFIRLSAL